MNAAMVRRLILPVHEALLGRNTLRYLRQLDASQWQPREALRALQEDKLRRLARHAYKNCPFHRNRFDAAGVDPNHVSVETLTRLPTLSKADIAANRRAMLAVGHRGAIIPYSTGGSTGCPLQFFIDRRRQASDQAARARSRRWFGIEPGERELYLWGSPMENSAQTRARAIRDRLTNHRLLNAFDMTPAAMTRYLDEIRRFDPVHLFGYPSSLARLARFAESTGRRMASPSLRAVFTSGEVLQPYDRQIIERQGHAPVADGYGSREGGFVAHQCPAGAYHVTMESHVVELLDADDRPVADGAAGEIVLTLLDAYAMPFIRYRTGDRARRVDGRCACGRGLELIGGIEGRSTDMLRTTSGGYTHGLSVIYVLRESPHIAEFRVVQRSNLDLDVSIVPRGEFDAVTQTRIADDLRRRIGETIDVRFNQVDRLPPDPSGKFRYVVGSAS